jgi:uncharacterized membrane-anchored protein
VGLAILFPLNAADGCDLFALDGFVRARLRLLRERRTPGHRDRQQFLLSSALLVSRTIGGNRMR